MPTSPTSDRGFTLIEVLVALLVFSLGALALVQLGSATTRTSAAIEARQLARIEMDNLATEWLSDPRAPAIGSASGVSSNAGRTWRWTRRVEPLEDDLLRIDGSVASDDGQTLASQTLVRRRE